MDDPRRRRRGWTDTSRYFLAMAVPIVAIHVYSTIRTTEQVYMYGRRRNPTKMIITDGSPPITITAALVRRRTQMIGRYP
jgi:hypothetical protein